MQQNNWIELLLITQLVINNKISIMIKELPFKTNHRMDTKVKQISKKKSSKDTKVATILNENENKIIKISTIYNPKNIQKKYSA